MKRVISGACYVIALLTFFLLKIYVDDLFFDLLIYAFALIGTHELVRAYKEKGKLTWTQGTILYVFTALSIPACAVCEALFGCGLQVISSCFILLLVIVFSLLVFNYEETSLESIGITLFVAVYPTLFLAMLTLGNHFIAPESMGVFDSRLFILLVFTISPCADTMAFIFGCTMKNKFPQKLAPEISPHKTLIGAIGGLVGGLLGACALYFIYNSLPWGTGNLPWGTFENIQIWLPIYLLLGLLGAAATMFGDLVESAIKRKLDLKDMGNLMPGHGGIMDRIDGMLFSGVVIYAAFILIYAIV